MSAVESVTVRTKPEKELVFEGTSFTIDSLDLDSDAAPNDSLKALFITLAKEGITSRSENHELNDRVEHFRSRYYSAQKTISRLQTELDRLKEKCQVFLDAMEHFPNFIRIFTERMTERIAEKLAAEREAREKAERRYWAKQHPHNPNKKKNDRAREVR